MKARKMHPFDEYMKSMQKDKIGGGKSKKKWM